MPRNQGLSVQRDFRAGLITEASGLNFPENACAETYNCEFDLQGRASRRLGINFEQNYQSEQVDKTASAITTYFWRNVSGDGAISFEVVQIGNTLYFYNTNDPVSLSNGLKASTIDLTDFSPPNADPPRLQRCQFSDGFGKLFVVHPHLEAFAVTYDSTMETFTGEQIDLQFRDFEGFDDGLAMDNRPTLSVATMTSDNPKHYYNLLNQGWNATVLGSWDTAFTHMPSNCDVWWNYKDSNNAFASSQVANDATGNSLAPKGHFILNVYDQQRDSVSGLTIADSDITTEDQRASTTAFFAGRVWYSGIGYPGFTSRIYFSQIVERTEQFGQCYQVNDPTSDELFDIQPSDGGVLHIPDGGTVYKLFVMQSALLVFTSRGVWSISGSSGLGFLANDFTVNKISSFRAVSASSFVDVNGVPIYWTSDGIYMVKQQQNTDGRVQFEVSPMTFNTIQSFYNAIPQTNKQFAAGFFNQQSQIVQWLYSTEEPATIENLYDYNRILVLDARTGAFYPWSVDTTNVKLHGLCVVDAAGAQTVEFNVINGADSVVDGSSNQVVAYANSQSTVVPSFKYLVAYESGGDTYFTQAEALDTRYVDFYSYDEVGSDYESYFITAYQLHGQGAQRFQSPYLFIYNEGTGSYVIQGVWDFSVLDSTGKFTDPQTMIHNPTGYSVSKKKVKIRGSGRTLQYKVSSVSGEAFTLLGWAALESINQFP